MIDKKISSGPYAGFDETGLKWLAKIGQIQLCTYCEHRNHKTRYIRKPAGSILHCLINMKRIKVKLHPINRRIINCPSFDLKTWI